MESHRAQPAAHYLCRQEHLTRDVAHAPCTCNHTHIVAQGSNVSVRISLHPHAIHDVTCLSVRLLCLRVCLSPVSLPLLPCLFHSLPVLCPALHLQCRHSRGLKTTALTHNEEYCPVAICNPLTGYEPKLLDNFDHSETSAMIFMDESDDIDTEPSYSCDAELDDETIGQVWRVRTRRWSPYSRLAECAGLPRTSGTGQEDKGREEVQEIERESQVEEKRSRGHDYGDDIKGLKHLEPEPRCVCG